MHQQSLILVAGGIGERTKKNIPKQFAHINGKPVIIYSLEKFLSYNPHIFTVIVCHAQYLDYCKQLISQYFDKHYRIHIITGGDTRFHSVKNGLEYLNQNHYHGIVAVHDAARPCISISLIQRCFETAHLHGNAIPCIPLTESIRKVINGQNTMTNRNEFVIVQTPQCADFSMIYHAFQNHYQPTFTDEANVLESAGQRIYLCEGEKNNIKITYPIDFEIASLILNHTNIYE